MLRHSVAFKAQVEKRANGDDEAEMMDEDYVMALEYGLLDMGFYDDIMQIVKFLPKERQTIMFSATMPCLLYTSVL